MRVDIKITNVFYWLSGNTIEKMAQKFNYADLVKYSYIKIKNIFCWLSGSTIEKMDRKFNSVDLVKIQ